jgi:hypothetical protein
MYLSAKVRKQPKRYKQFWKLRLTNVFTLEVGASPISGAKT